MFRRAIFATLLAVAAVDVAAATQISIGGCAGPGAGYGTTTCVGGATTADFNSATVPANFSGTGAVFSGTTGTWATPAGDRSPYLAVSTTAAGTEDLTLPGLTNYFGLLWGSIDDYNHIELYLNHVRVDTIDGASVRAVGTANGNQFLPGSNEYVNIMRAGGFDEVKLITTHYNFEVDNIAYAQVPEPGAVGLLALGMLGVVAVRRRHG